MNALPCFQAVWRPIVGLTLGLALPVALFAGAAGVHVDRGEFMALASILGGLCGLRTLDKHLKARSAGNAG